MTEKLYYHSPYTKTWNTDITHIEQKDDTYWIQLKETAFYPEGGGQPADQGTINGMSVIDVQEDGPHIYHILRDKPSLGEASCEINWERRFDHMQHHSAQHLLSAVCIELYDAKTMSFHLGTEMVSIDLATADLSTEQLNNIEKKVNEYITANYPIETYMVTEEELSSIPLRKLPDVTEDIRIVEIKGEIDYSACCGTHVARLGEIGLIKLIKTEKQKRNTRLHFKAGSRALKDYGEAQDILTIISNRFSTSRSEVIERLDKWEQEQKALQRELDELKEAQASYVAKELLSSAESNLIAKTFDNQSMKEMQLLAASLKESFDGVILIASASEKKILLTHAGTASLKCGQLFKEHLPSYNGKGGGNDKQAQAGFNTVEELQSFVTFVKDFI